MYDEQSENASMPGIGQWLLTLHAKALPTELPRRHSAWHSSFLYTAKSASAAKDGIA